MRDSAFMLAALGLFALWRHGASDDLGWPEKIAMLGIAALIVRAVVRFQAGMVR